jgi:hypothetical protein
MRVAGILASCALLGVAACAESDSVPTEYPTARVLVDCAPWDGPALTVLLANSTSDSTTFEGEHMTISVWRGIAGLAGTRINLAKEGAAARCDATGECIAALSGWVRFDHVDRDDHATGRFLIDFADSTVSGSFDAKWLRRRVLCG